MIMTISLSTIIEIFMAGVGVGIVGFLVFLFIFEKLNLGNKDE